MRHIWHTKIHKDERQRELNIWDGLEGNIFDSVWTTQLYMQLTNMEPDEAAQGR